MKARMKFFAGLVVALTFLVGEVGFAAPKTLIDMKGGSPAAGLAKSWKKVKDGEYEFVLDTSLEVKKGVNVSPAIVKEALETKLGASYGVKVTEKGASGVSVTYTGDEKKFLEQVGKTKIRAGGGDADLALEDSVSEGGIRAKTTDRAPTEGEVKAVALKLDGNVIIATVNASKSSKLKSGKIKVQGPLKDLKAKEKFFFKPGKQENGIWIPEAGTLQ